MNNQVHLEQIVTGEMTLNIVEHPAVQEQVTVHEIPQVLERIQEQTEEQIVHVSAPPIVDDTAEVVPIVPGSPLPQTREESSDILRFQKLLLSSVAALGRLQSSASSLYQRITEHERLIHENRLPEQMADQIQHAPKSGERADTKSRDEVCLGRDDASPPPWWEEAGERSPDSMQLFCFLCSPPTPRLLVTWYGTTCPSLPRQEAI